MDTIREKVEKIRELEVEVRKAQSQLNYEKERLVKVLAAEGQFDMLMPRMERIRRFLI